MLGIDLIPNAYRRHMQARRMVRQIVLLLVMVLLASLAITAYLLGQLQKEKKEVQALQSAVMEFAELPKQLELLQSQKRKLETSARALELMRGKREIANLVQALDQSMNDHVWLTTVRFERVQRVLDPSVPAQPSGKQTEEVQLTGIYDEVAKRDQTWVFSTRLELSGTATSHGALNDFFNSLSQRPSVASLRFLNSSKNGAEANEEVKFSFDATIRSKENPL